MVLWRAVTLLSPNTVTIVDVVRAELTEHKLMTDPQLNIRSFYTKVREIAEDLISTQPESWVHNRFSKLIALNIMDQPAKYEQEFPLLLRAKMNTFIEKHIETATTYEEFETDMEVICQKYEELVVTKLWPPVSNKSRTKEVSMFAKLESKLNTIEKKLNGGTSGPTLAPKMSEDGKIKLEAGKKYSTEEFSSLSKADKTYLDKLRKQAKSSGGGGGGKVMKERRHPKLLLRSPTKMLLQQRKVGVMAKMLMASQQEERNGIVAKVVDGILVMATNIQASNTIQTLFHVGRRKKHQSQVDLFPFPLLLPQLQSQRLSGLLKSLKKLWKKQLKSPLLKSLLSLKPLMMMNLIRLRMVYYLVGPP